MSTRSRSRSRGFPSKGIPVYVLFWFFLVHSCRKSSIHNRSNKSRQNPLSKDPLPSLMNTGWSRYTHGTHGGIHVPLPRCLFTGIQRYRARTQRRERTAVGMGTKGWARRRPPLDLDGRRSARSSILSSCTATKRDATLGRFQPWNGLTPTPRAPPRACSKAVGEILKARATDALYR